MGKMRELAVTAAALCLWLLTPDARGVDSTQLDDAQTRLRREIADRARLLREIRSNGSVTDSSGWRTSTTTSGSGSSQGNRQQTVRQGSNFADPFGTALDFAAQTWDTAARTQSGSSSSGQRDSRRSRQPTDRPLDLNGRPLTPIQVTRTPTATPAAAPPKTGKETKDAGATVDATAQVTQDAQLLFDNGEYGAARQILVPIAASRQRPPQEIDAARQSIERIDTLGTKMLTEADEAAARGDTDRAASLYDNIVKKFGTAPAAQVARNILFVLKADPEVGAKFLFDRAVSYADRGRADVAAQLLREIAKRYGSTKQAAAAAALLQRLEGGKAGGLSVDDELAARRWLIIGDIHGLNGRPEQAVESYRMVIQEFEDSKYAEMARAKIAELARK